MNPEEAYDFALLPVEAFRGSASAYYDDAERYIEGQWKSLIWPEIQHFNFEVTLDFAAGHGRNSTNLAKLAKKLYIVDANPEAVQFLRQRFEGDAQTQCTVSVIQNNGIDLSEVPSGAVTALYSFDSMVHFEKRLIEAYMPEFQRVMAPGALGFIHHSNFGRVSDDPDFRNHPAWRANVDQNFFAQCCFRHQLLAIRQVPIVWWVGEVAIQDFDCLTIILKPKKWPVDGAETAVAPGPEYERLIRESAALNWRDQRIHALVRELNDTTIILREQEERIRSLELELKETATRLREREERILDLENSWSWKLTKPLRFIGK
jgi:ubiquinone/menaquinone biosynthesis C-methylase UbiE